MVQQVSGNGDVLSTPYEIFLKKFVNMPFWFKEAVLADLTKNLYLEVDIQKLYATPLFTKIIPKITYIGKKELKTKEMKLPQDVYKFMRQAALGHDITTITLNNFWSLEKTAHCFSVAYSKEMLEIAGNVQTPIEAAYLGGELKLGEYLKRLGLVDVEQITKALQQQNLEATNGNKILIGKIFTSMGIVKEEDITHILKIKQDAKKIVILPICNGEKCTAMKQLFHLKQVNAKMLHDIKDLQQKLNTKSSQNEE